MDTTHLTAFASAMQRKDIDAMLTHMADDVVLRTPLVAEPFIGKAAVRPVVEALFRVVDSFELIEMMLGPKHASQFFRATAGSERLDGIDYWRVNDAGLIQEMTVLWRPLPAVAAVQAQLDSLERVPTEAG
jgi:hypothetical protein